MTLVDKMLADLNAVAHPRRYIIQQNMDGERSIAMYDPNIPYLHQMDAFMTISWGHWMDEDIIGEIKRLAIHHARICAFQMKKEA